MAGQDALVEMVIVLAISIPIVFVVLEQIGKYFGDNSVHRAMVNPASSIDLAVGLGRTLSE